jgi:hypothetical protein
MPLCSAGKSGLQKFHRALESGALPPAVSAAWDNVAKMSSGWLGEAWQSVGQSDAALKKKSQRLSRVGLARRMV